MTIRATVTAQSPGRASVSATVPRVCSIEGCDKPHEANGLCTHHYDTWRHHGDPLTPVRIHGDDVARFWSKVYKHGPLAGTDTLAAGKGQCWLWTDTPGTRGYGAFNYAAGDRRITLRAHQYAYELLVGPVPEGLELDHLCRVHNCVNPSHLEAVTHRENILRGEGLAAKAARQTHCVNGHPFSGDNLRVNAKGHRRCRTCVYEAGKRRDARKRKS